MSLPVNPPLFGANGLLAVTRRNINIHSYGVISGIMGERIVEAMPLRLRCECPVPSCEEIIEVILATRRELRREFPTGFIVVQSHVGASAEYLYQSVNYCVVSISGYDATVVDL
jgi:hypothetical protein